jgi:hypothetical protein
MPGYLVPTNTVDQSTTVGGYNLVNEIKSVGLDIVVPTSITVGSGSGNVSANGLVSFTGASSISLINCFSSTYDNYKIIFESNLNMPANGTNELRIRLRTSSGDDSTNGYGGGYSYLYPGDSAISPVRGGVQPGTYMPIGSAFYNTAVMEASFEILGFNSARAKTLSGISVGGGGASAGSSDFGGYLPVNTHTGMTIYSSSTGTYTGTIRVYGYNNGVG